MTPQLLADLKKVLEAVDEAASNGDFWNIPDLKYTQAEIDAAGVNARAATVMRELEDSSKALGRVFLERLAKIQSAL